jgi:uncharacterized protein
LNKVLPFEQVVSTEEELRALLGTSSELVAHKVISHLDEHCRHFIAQSPLVLLATSDASGTCDVSPRGDAPGFVMVLDEKRLLIPERPGNRKIDSMRNLLTNPHAGLLFLIPGLEETLRVNGRAFVVRDEELLQQMAVNGRIPLLGIGVEVEECFVHCAKAFKRSHLWQPDAWPAKETLPSPAKMLVAHAKLPGLTEETVTEALRDSYTNRLY